MLKKKHPDPVSCLSSLHDRLVLNFSFCQYIQYLCSFQALRKTTSHRFYSHFSPKTWRLQLHCHSKPGHQEYKCGHQEETKQRLFWQSAPTMGKTDYGVVLSHHQASEAQWALYFKQSTCTWPAKIIGLQNGKRTNFHHLLSYHENIDNAVNSKW